MKQMRIVLALAASLLSSGCFQMKSAVTVSGDGSGTIVQRLVFSQEALAQLRQLSAFSGTNGKPFDPVSEDEARAQAAKIGSGVTYVSSMPVNDASGQGRETTYAFKDITGLRLNQQAAAPGGVSVQGNGVDATRQTIGFSLSKLPNGNALLTITVPQPDLAAMSLGGAGRSEATPEQLAMVKQMFAGARMTITVAPAGTLVRSSSPYVSGNQVTLLDIDFDQLMAGSTLDRLMTAKTPDEAKAMLKDVPGLTVSLDPEITIEFAPGRD
jgi:hypothetical protein